MKIPRIHVMMCFGTGCVASGAPKVKEELVKELAKRDLGAEVSLIETGCNGFCAGGPIMVLYPGGYFYHDVATHDVPDIVEEHILKGRPLERLMFRHPLTQKPIPLVKDIPFFARQCVRVLRNKGRMAAESIEEYIAQDGYMALGRALTEMTPEQIIDEVKRSGLRGRGGAGFPTGLKWELCRKAPGTLKYILCNADEGDPGAFMDRSLLEADPHSVLEGMMIGAKAIGASEGYIYCRAEYPLALERLGLAIRQCRDYGLLGPNILGTDFSFDLFVSQGSGAFVCGEETALMRSVEGLRGEPRPRPPFPAYKGLWDKPSVLNNVETFANVPLILRNGVEWYRSVGTERSPGTKIFALTGKVNNIGLVEVPMGVTLGEIVYEIGGGIPDGKDFKAAQLGGPSGGCIPAEYTDVPLDYESVVELGAIMGSGGLIVMDEDSCMVDMARFFLDFVQDESCGKCTPCRIGTKRMLEILTRICQGQGEEGDIEKLVTLGKTIKDTALCGLGQTAPNPVLSTIRHFRSEYEAHIRDKYCPSMVCKRISPAPCQRACPVGVDVPSYNALTSMGRFDEALEVIRQDNPFPGVCGRLCSRACEANCLQNETSESTAIRSLKRFLADHEGLRWKPQRAPLPTTREEKVAIIGSGPAGLTAARDLRREGYPVTVFEAASKPGGMLGLAVPDFRLPPEVLDRDIQAILDTGVELQTGVAVGKDVTLDGLRKQGYKAILLATGAHKPARLALPGLDGACLQAADFLKDVKHGKRPKLGSDVLVIGCTYAALDAARTAIRLGCPNVGLIYPRDKGQMPFEEAEWRAAEEEGVAFHCLHQPLEVVRTQGKVTGVRCQRREAQAADQTGRARSVPTAEPDVVLPASTVVVGTGQEPDLSVLSGGPKLARNPWGLLVVDPVSLATNEPGVFAAGEVTTGSATVIEAIAAGQKAATVIHCFLRGIPYPATYKLARPRRRVEFLEAGESFENFKRPQEALRPAGERAHDFREADVTFSEMLAICEAKRCLRCDMD